MAISNSILDKNGKLTDAEWALVRAHPCYSGTILRRVPTFERVAMLAEQHHERLDGSGYPHRKTEVDLGVESRIIALADCYSAMAEARPYREARPKDEVLHLLKSEIPLKLDADCFEALESATRHWAAAFPEAADTMNTNATPTPEFHWSWPPLTQALS